MIILVYFLKIKLYFFVKNCVQKIWGLTKFNSSIISLKIIASCHSQRNSLKLGGSKKLWSWLYSLNIFSWLLSY